MAYVDFILNLAGLLLWLNWRSIRFDPLTKRTPATLMGTLRPAAPKKLQRWHFLVLIAGLLFLRALIYWWIGSTLNWVGKLDLGLTVPCFICRGDWHGLAVMVTFSFSSFGLALGVFYLCLLPLSLLDGPEPIHRLIKMPLGRLDDWPRWAKISLPLLGGALCWWLASWVFDAMQILPDLSAPARFKQSVFIGLACYLVWKFPLSGILMLHLLSSYIYFGKHPFWKYINATAQILLRPLQKVPLRLGRVDFAPLVGLAVIFLAAEFLARGLWSLYAKLLS